MKADKLDGLSHIAIMVCFSARVLPVLGLNGLVNKVLHKWHVYSTCGGIPQLVY